MVVVVVVQAVGGEVVGSLEQALGTPNVHDTGHLTAVG